MLGDDVAITNAQVEFTNFKRKKQIRKLQSR